MHFARRLAYWANMRGEETFLICGAERLTWRAFDQRACALAATFQTLGVKPGDRIGCLLENSVEWCVSFAAAIYVDAIFVPLNVMFGPLELREIDADAECKIIISTAKLMAKLTDQAFSVDADIVCVFPGAAASGAPLPFERASAGPARPTASPNDPTHALTICYTSGTTGVPKGVVHTHDSIDAMLASLSAGFGFTSDDTILITAPLPFAGGYICSLAPAFYLGFRVILERSFDAPRALALFAKERVTTYGGVPPLWQRIADTPGFDDIDISSLRHAYTGGAPVSVPLLSKFRDKGVVIRQSYGCTEASGGATLADAASALARPHACGRATMGLDLEIQDDEGGRCAPGDVGEICLRGPQMMREYWRKPAMTAEAFANGWYHTGDLGYVDEYGGVVVVDRKKSMVISGGVNVYPAQVERVIATLPGISEIVVLGAPSEAWGEEVVAIAYGQALDPIALRDAAKELLGGYKAPKHIRVSATPLPKTASGKIARGNLLALYESLTP